MSLLDDVMAKLKVKMDAQNKLHAKQSEAPDWMRRASSAPQSGGLMGMPDIGASPISPVGGLMDFNALALQLAGDPGPQMRPRGMPNIQAAPTSPQMGQDFMSQFMNPFATRGRLFPNPMMMNQRANIGVRG